MVGEFLEEHVQASGGVLARRPGGLALRGELAAGALGVHTHALEHEEVPGLGRDEFGVVLVVLEVVVGALPGLDSFSRFDAVVVIEMRKRETRSAPLPLTQVEKAPSGSRWSGWTADLLLRKSAAPQASLSFAGPLREARRSSAFVKRTSKGSGGGWRSWDARIPVAGGVERAGYARVWHNGVAARVRARREW